MESSDQPFFKVFSQLSGSYLLKKNHENSDLTTWKAELISHTTEAKMEQNIIERLLMTFAGAFVGFIILRLILWPFKKGIVLLDKALDRLDEKRQEKK